MNSSIQAAMQYLSFGDAAMIIKAGDDLSPETNAMIHKLLYLFDEKPVDGVVDLVPSYNELMVCYDPVRLNFGELMERAKLFASHLEQVVLPEGELISIPVLYGGADGADLDYVARVNQLSEQEVIRIHSEAEYRVYMLGFTPGFCYLGGMDKRLHTPRKASPRLRVAAGSVGIAGSQTGIYPVESPGGWQIIGKTHAKLFDPGSSKPFLLKPGDRVCFVPHHKIMV